jgi:hypothetical protein
MRTPIATLRSRSTTPGVCRTSCRNLGIETVNRSGNRGKTRRTAGTRVRRRRHGGSPPVPPRLRGCCCAARGIGRLQGLRSMGEPPDRFADHSLPWRIRPRQTLCPGRTWLQPSLSASKR